MTASLVVRHNFETAHRLPFLPGKCTSLHGHSWWAEVSITGQPDENGVLIDFGLAKKFIREWIDRWLDHGTMLGRDDRLRAPLADAGCKVFVFDPTDPANYCQGTGPFLRELAWPTVENVAELLRRVVVDFLAHTVAARLSVSVRVTETHVNEATAGQFWQVAR